MNNELIEQTAEKRIEYLERSGILGKASQTMAAAYLLTQIADRLFFAVQDELLRFGFIHQELKRNWNSMVHSRDKTMKVYEREFINTEKQRNDLIYDFESFFPRICGLLQIEKEAAYFCGMEVPEEFMPEKQDYGKPMVISIRTFKAVSDTVSAAAKREGLSRQEFLSRIIERVAALELQKQASEAEAAPYADNQ